jgi:two-component system response regulator FixJ
MIEPTVYIVDDEPAIRHSLELLLRSVGLAAEAFASGTAFLDAYSPALDGCLIADVRMPGMSGLELQEALAARGATLPVIIITGHGDISMAVRAMKAGATDFIEKPFNEQALLDAVHRALARRKQADPAGTGRAEIEARVTALTPREKEVLLLVAEGRPNKVVATRLGLSTRTVEVHRAKVMEKMQARSLADLVRMAITCDLVQT